MKLKSLKIIHKNQQFDEDEFLFLRGMNYKERNHEFDKNREPNKKDVILELTKRKRTY